MRPLTAWASPPGPCPLLLHPSRPFASLLLLFASLLLLVRKCQGLGPQATPQNKSQDAPESGQEPNGLERPVGLFLEDGLPWWYPRQLVAHRHLHTEAQVTPDTTQNNTPDNTPDNRVCYQRPAPTMLRQHIATHGWHVTSKHATRATACKLSRRASLHKQARD